jgi:hypothetical protein
MPAGKLSRFDPDAHAVGLSADLLDALDEQP